MRVPTLYCDDGSETELPICWQICSACNGHGKSSAYLGAFTQSDMDEQGPEFFDDYMSGTYDRSCDRCEGTGKVAVADVSKMTKQQRTAYSEQRREDALDRSIERAERAMGA